MIDRGNWMYYHPIRKMYLQLSLDRAQAPGKGTLSITPTKSKEPLNNSLCSVPTRCISRNLPLVKMISAQNSHYLSAFLLLFLKKGRLPPVSGYGEFSPGHGKRIQIGTSEHGVQSVLVFLQTTIHGFPVAELTLDDPERVLYFAAHR